MGLIQMVDNNLVSSHEEMRQLLYYTAIGATVIVEPITDDKCHLEGFARTGRITFVLDRAPHHTCNSADIYALPSNAARWQKRIVKLLDEAMTRVDPLELWSNLH